MQNNLFRRIIAVVLVITMVAGQLMVSQAYAAEDDLYMVSDGTDNTVEPSEEPAEEPAPTETEEYVEPGAGSAPKDSEPVPTESEPAPTESEPVPTESEPVPTESEPVPTESEPAPTESEPVPTESEPVPTESEPIPTESEPAATETEPEATEANELMLLAEGEDEPQPLAETGSNGGLSILVTSSQTEVKDGDQYTFSVTIADDDLDTLPNITPGDVLTIKLPEFLTSSDMDKALQNCFAYFEKNYVYDEANHILKLTVKNSNSGTWANIKFDISMTVDTIGYDGDGDGSIDVGLGDVSSGTNKGEADTGVDVDVGLGDGSGNGTGSGDGEGDGDGGDGDGNPGQPVEEPYLQKNIWSNYKLSQYGIGSESFVMREPDDPIGYSVAFGVNKNYSGYATLEDNLSNGNLTLCDKDGNTNVQLYQCFQVYVDGVLQTHSTPGTDSVTYYSNVLGNITIAKNGSGFKVTCHNDSPNTEATGVVDVIIRYFAAVTGDDNDITNTVTLTINDQVIDSDSSTIRQYDSQGLTVTKSIVDGNNTYQVINIDENTNEITFRLTLTQYGTGSYYKSGMRFTYDTLADCFSFVSEVNENPYFRLEKEPGNDQQINVIKKNDVDIPTGVTYIDFKVSIDPNKLSFGEQTTNTVGNTVYIRHKAKLTINKTWTGTDVDKGEGAKFGLYNGDTLVAETGMSTGNSFVLYLNADSLANNTHTYTLKETVDPDSGYVASKPIEVVITKSSTKITIDSIDGVPYDNPTGQGTAAVTNVPDSGMGTLKFKKYGGSVNDSNLIDGGVYQLYKVTDDGDVKVGDTFITVNGVKEFTDLPYGTYYVKEISAPSGYLIQSNGTTGNVELKKTAPNQELNLVNKLYQDGKVRIQKVDAVTQHPLANATFTLTPASGTAQTKTTGSDGVVEFTGLTAGVYTITETRPVGYSGFAGPFVVTIDENGNTATILAENGKTVSGSTITINWENTQLFGSFKLTKYGANTDTPLEGAKFELYDSSNKKVGEGTTNANGELSFDNLAFGSYTLKEVEPPEGYVLSTELANGVTVKIESTNQVTQNYTNTTEKGSITITKTEAGTSNKLSGAVFGLYSDANASDLLQQKTTDGSGVCSFTNLEKGTYYVKEITAPTGYQLNPNVFEFKVGQKDGNGSDAAAVWSFSKTVENSKRVYKLQVVKTNEHGTAYLEGAEFTLSGNGIESVTKTTNADGIAVFENLPFGTYTVTETKAPNGYALVAPFTVTIDENNTPATYVEGYVVHCDNVKDCHTQLTVLKVDDKNTGKGLPGTKFVVKSGEQYVIASGSDGSYTFDSFGETGTEFVTGTDGTFLLEYLPLGSYTLKETAAPEGYIISEEERGFEIKNAEQSLTVGNTQIKAKVSLVKMDEYGKLLEGVGFTLSTSAGKVLASGENGVYTYTGLGEEATPLYTSADGSLSIDGLLWGIYTLDEVAESAPEGLIPVSGIQFTVSAGEHSKTIQIDSEAVRNLRNLGSVSFKKVDSKGNALSGAVFMLDYVSGTAYSAKEARFAVSGNDGIVTFKDVPYGVYKITEVTAPYGKELSDEVHYVSVNGARNADVTLTAYPFDWVNEDTKIKVTVKKVSTDGSALSGAIFRILGEDQETVVMDMLTVNSLTGEQIELPIGVYYLEEVKAPENYVMEDTPIRFEVTLSGPNEIVVKNAPFTGSLTIAKAAEKIDDAEGTLLLSGAEFKVFDKAEYIDYIKNGKQITALYTVTTNADGKITIEDIPFGDYVVIETKAPDGYELNTQPKYFTIGEDEDTADVELTFVDEKSRYVLVVSKEDIRNEGKLLPNARFAVTGNGFYTEVVTGPDGTVVVEVPAPGTYQVMEIGAPEGYTIDPYVYTVEVTGHTSVGEEISSRFVSRDYPTVVKLYKVDEAGESLDGAEFELYSVTNAGEQLVHFTENDGTYVCDPDSDVTTIKAGSAVIENLPVGGYILRETKSPDGYMNLGDISFAVDEDKYDQALELRAENLPYSRGLAICKDNDSGIRLAGAEFSLYSADGELLKAVTTDASGYAVFQELGSGSYYIQETKAPTGYQTISDKIAFEIDGDGELKSDFDFSMVGTEELPFYVLTVTDDYIEHQLQLKKISAMSGTPLEGAQFRVLGNGINTVYVTGSDGLTEVISLPIGEYMLTEIKAPNGYAADGESRHLEVKPDGIGLDGKALTGEIPVYTVSNQPLSFRLAVVKQDETTAEPLAGAAFTVTGEDGSKYYLVTDENGQTDSITLMPGKYAVAETVAPAGYNVPLAGWSFTVEEGSQLISSISGSADYTFTDGLLTLTLTNKRTTGSLMIYKYDADNESQPLSGAKFKIVDAKGEMVWFTVKNGVYHVADADESGAGNVLTTNAMGQALLDGLIFGNYAVQEVKAPVGYKLLTEDLLVKLTEQDETMDLKVANEKLLRKVTVIKQSADENPLNLIGAVFTLHGVDADGNWNYISEATTLYDGKAEFTVPYGDYVIVETRAPEGYELSDAGPWFFSYDADTPEDAEFTYTFVNEKSVYNIEVYKFDADQPDKGLAGAEFAFTDSRGYTKVVTTGPDGIARLEDVTYDDYTVREISAPEGYYLNDEVYTVSREELKHGAAVRIEAPNTFIIGAATLKKVDSEDPTKILDAEFTVSDGDGNLLHWEEIDEGYALSEKGDTVIHAGDIKLTNLPAGDYTITEVKAPDGYLILDESRTFTIDAENALAGIEIEIENLQRKSAVGITKIDAADKKTRLEGAEFTLYAVVDGVAGDAVMTVTTDENGLAVFTDIPMGDYRIVETKAPYGYKLWTNPVDFSIDAEGNVLVGKNKVKVPESDKVHMFGMLNESIIQELTIKKISAEDGTALAGAVFTVTGADSSWRITTGEDGTAVLSLPYGDYVLEELIAPDGYVLDESKHLIVVTEKGITINGAALEEFTYVIENTSVAYPLALHKQDISNGKALSGAEFTISGNGVTHKLKTNASGDSNTVYLTPGQYTISETDAPEGYKQPLDGWTLTVSKDGRISVEGKDATIAVNAGSATLTVENEKKTPPTPGTGTGTGIAKTGQGSNSELLLSGAALMLLSFSGLLYLMLDENKRRRVYRSI